MTFLLTGVDSGHDRAHALTDTLLVASLDRRTNKAVMLSIPRDISNFPLYSGGTFRGKINSLMSTAGNDPKQFPDGPVLTLTREIGYLIGVPINYYAAINLDGLSEDGRPRRRRRREQPEGDQRPALRLVRRNRPALPCRPASII